MTRPAADPHLEAAIMASPHLPHGIITVGRTVMALVWLMALLAAGLAQAATTWLVLEHNLVVLPAYGSLGLGAYPSELGLQVLPIVELPVAGGMPSGPLTSVDGRDVTGRSAVEIAGLLPDRDGERVALVIKEPGADARTVVLTRTGPNRAAMEAQYAPLRAVLAQIANLLAALALIAAALLLRFRRSELSLAWAFSFAFLMLATVGSDPAWSMLGAPQISAIIDTIWISLLLIAIPALPTGKYVPRWTRWAVVAGPVLGLALINAGLDRFQTEPIRLLMLSAALGCVLLRFAYTPSGAERQQMKWASLGLAVGLIMFAGAIILSFAGISYSAFDIPRADGLRTFGTILHRISFLTMAAGVVVSLMDYRLNDADAAVGRSAGYALLTTLIAVVWAVGGAWINRAIGFVTGDGDPTLSTALSTLVALSLLAPAQSRILTWTEARFQRALVRLRSLPDRLAAWRHGDDPRPLAQSALASIVEGLNADQAALVLIDDAGRVDVLAAHNVPEQTVVEALTQSSTGVGASLFQLKLALATDDCPKGYLLLGRRSDGANYSRDERSAVLAILPALSIAIKVTGLRARHKAALLEIITSMEARVAGIEAGRPAAAL